VLLKQPKDGASATASTEQPEKGLQELISVTHGDLALVRKITKQNFARNRRKKESNDYLLITILSGNIYEIFKQTRYCRCS
jgi:hypothetical protein